MLKVLFLLQFFKKCYRKFHIIACLLSCLPCPCFGPLRENLLGCRSRWRLHACHELRCGVGRFWSAPAPGVKVTFRTIEFVHPELVKYY